MKRKKRLRYLLIGLFVIIVLYFIINTTLDVLRSVYNFGSKRLLIIAIYYIITCLFIVLPSIAFLVHGRRLYREIKKISSEKGKEHLKKVCTLLCLQPLNYYQHII